MCVSGFAALIRTVSSQALLGTPGREIGPAFVESQKKKKIKNSVHYKKGPVFCHSQ